MSGYLEVTSNDTSFYNERLRDFLPSKIIDCHTHIWLEEFKSHTHMPVRTVLWPNMVARDNSAEEMMSIYSKMFPDKEVIPVVFGCVYNDYDIKKCNTYVREKAAQYKFPSLMVATPTMNVEQLEKDIRDGGFFGCKVYLNFSPSYISEKEIRIYDFLPPEQLAMLDRNGWAVMLHIARANRLKDPLNLAQLMEIDEKYPNAKVIVAHIGRAYTNEDLGNSMNVLKYSKNLLFDFSANTNSYVMSKLVETVGIDRIMFGSDMPLTKMRARRIVEDGIYINLVPKGLYGNISNDIHMREVENEEADKITYFLYEEIDAFKKVAQDLKLSKEEIEKIFYKNAAKLFGIE